MLFALQIDQIIEKFAQWVKPDNQFQETSLNNSRIEKLTLVVFLLLLAHAANLSTSLLQQARIDIFLFRVESIFNGWNDFQSHFQAIPGDFAYASVHIDSQLKNGNNNGLLDTPTERFQAWLHLHRSGALKLNEKDIPLDNTFGHPLSLTLLAPHNAQLTDDSKAHNILALGPTTPLSALIALDKKIDDGLIEQGKLRLATPESTETVQIQDCHHTTQSDLKPKSLTCSAYLILSQ